MNLLKEHEEQQNSFSVDLFHWKEEVVDIVSILIYTWFTIKSTIINRLIPGAMMETGDISRKSQRGKHTTRHSELFQVEGLKNTMVFDTPGFTSFDILEAGEEELQFCYPEIGRLAGSCRYDNCRHLAEPGCAVKEALERGEINRHRYESYRLQMEELRK